jgi:hypothetical protein
MEGDKIKNIIKLILIDSINDDVQGMYELYYGIKNFSNDLIREKKAIKESLYELYIDGFIELIKIENPSFKEIGKVNEPREVIFNDNNWLDSSSENIYGVQSINISKSIALEMQLSQTFKQ